MRLLIDECVEAALTEALRADGHDVTQVSEVMSGADDPLIVERAGAEARILITNDRGFGNIRVSDAAAATLGVVILRIPEWKQDERLRLTREVLDRLDKQLVGHFVIVDRDKFRLRPLRRG